MFDKILNLFKTNEEDIESNITANELFADKSDEGFNDTPVCQKCYLGSNFTEKVDTKHTTCKWFKKWFVPQPNYDKTKDSILIVDDNPGIISFMIDDIESLSNPPFDIESFNILTFDTNYAAYQFEATQHSYQGLNIKYAILDLTLGGTLTTENGPVKYTGVDIYQQILIYNPEVKVLFYTGNSLNEYVNASKKLITQFSELTDGADINDYVLFKTSLDMDGRRKFLANWFKV